MFFDRIDAGNKLAKKLLTFKDDPHSVIVGLARGGVVLAAVVAKILHLPLNVICPRKLGAPANPELAIGAVTATGSGYYNEELIQMLGVSKSYLKEEVEREVALAKKRTKLYEPYQKQIDVEDKCILLIDDGLATGATMKASIATMRDLGASKIVVAVPVSPEDTAEEIEALADEIVILEIPSLFQAVGQYYDYFYPVEDNEVITLLKEISRQINKEEKKEL